MPETTPIQADQAIQIPHTLRLSAAERLVASPGRRQAARRLIASAPNHGIDLDLMWGVTDEGLHKPKKVRQVSLAVLGSGRTAMMFLSNPEQHLSLGPIPTQIQEISASIRAALEGLRAYCPAKVALAQTLIEPEHTWAHDACTGAGMICVGTLDYMRKPLPSPNSVSTDKSWPAGIEVRPIRNLDPNAPDADRADLIAALEGSYIDTLDCPELCGLRSMDDVVDSHMATGEFAPARWHLIYKDNQPAGCCLLSHIPQSHSIELVYLGIAPPARGLGLGRSVLEHAITDCWPALGPQGVKEITCAVDSRNLPAIKIYESMGFERFDARVGFVAPITPK